MARLQVHARSLRRKESVIGASVAMSMSILDDRGDRRRNKFCKIFVANILGWPNPSQQQNSLRYCFLPTFGGVVKNLVSAAKLVEILVLPTFLQVVKNVVSVEKLVEILVLPTRGQKHRLSGKTC